jgi:hypothetical protein
MRSPRAKSHKPHHHRRTKGPLLAATAKLTMCSAGVLAACVTVLMAAVGPASASAAEGPVWKVLGVSNPTNFKPGDQRGDDSIEVMVTNVGGGSTDGSPITITDTPPAALTVTQIFGHDTYKSPSIELENEDEYYGIAPGALDCSLAPGPHCVSERVVDPGDTLFITVQVSVTPGLSASAPNVVTVSGGGAASVSASDPVTISPELPEFGIVPGALFAATSTNQAGGHPNVTTAFFLNTVNRVEELLESVPAGTPKDIRFDVPPGLVGTTVGMPRCTMVEVVQEGNCPADTMVGTATLFFNNTGAHDLYTAPVFNIAPAPGEPAAFAFSAALFPVRLDTSVLSDGDDAVRVTVPDITEGAEVIGSSITLWGVPADHNGPGPDYAARNLSSSGSRGAHDVVVFGGPSVEQAPVALLSNPSQCSEPLEATLSTDSWEAPGPGVFKSASTSLGTGTGCGQLSFSSSVSMLPDTLVAGAPAGYTFDLKVPQNTEPGGLATPDVRRVVATLPQGVVISPSAADGLGDCSDEQFFGPGPREQTPAVPGACPRDSQVGTVSIKSPDLEEPLAGEVYLASPLCDPCSPGDAQDGRMVRLFVQVVGEGESGVVVKLEGTGEINQETGQVTTTFSEDPRLPFSEFKLTLQGGERATLANPRTCGPATTTVDLTPWSTPYTPDATPSSTFDVDEGCFGAQFDPSFSAGTTDNQAGEYSPFTLSFGRSDSDEFLNGLQLKMPPGLLGMLSKVSLCGEPQAGEGTCGPESLIGETSVETGPGTDPFLVTGGKVYITGPYKGAPYGLSIVVPAVAGPYTLSGTTGKGTVVVRAAISVDPQTAALTVTADPLPTMLDGIPLQLRLVNVTINRPGFTFNPTDCNKLAVTGTVTSTQAATADVSSPFQVTNCAALGFKPGFAVSTSGRTSKVGGASLDAKVTYPAGAQANIAKVKVDLPKQLPSRLTTLQKACLARVFEANPANCPSGSVVGIVKASSPVLPTGLTGPVYFVSHGGEAFPSLEVILQGEGVRVDLVAQTFISKAGITSSTFNSIPDVPISSFELYLPEGPDSALAANGDLCTSKLAMPTAFVAQNGTEIHETTKITVTGCPKAKKAAKKKAKAKAKGKAGAGKSSRARKASTSKEGRA